MKINVKYTEENVRTAGYFNLAERRAFYENEGYETEEQAKEFEIVTEELYRRDEERKKELFSWKFVARVFDNGCSELIYEEFFETYEEAKDAIEYNITRLNCDCCYAEGCIDKIYSIKERVN